MACHRCCNPLLLLAGSHSLAGISFQTSDETDASGPGGSGPISISLPTDRDCSLLLSLLAGFALFKRPQVPRDGGGRRDKETRFDECLKGNAGEREDWVASLFNFAQQCEIPSLVFPGLWKR